MSQINETFFTAVGCMDGRVQEIVARFGKEKFGATFPDTITEAGLVGLLSRDPIEQTLLDGLKFKIANVSLGKHASSGIIVHGHQECAGNPVDDDKQRDDIRRSVAVITDLIGSSVPTIGVFVIRGENGWQIEELSQTELV